MHKYIRPVLRQITEVSDWEAGMGSLCVCAYIQGVHRLCCTLNFPGNTGKGIECCYLPDGASVWFMCTEDKYR